MENAILMVKDMVVRGGDDGGRSGAMVEVVMALVARADGGG